MGAVMTREGEVRLADALPTLRADPVPYAWWTLAGAAFGFAVAGILTIGPPILLLALAMVVCGARVRRLRGAESYLILVGISAAPWFLAWLNRDGPGTVCRVAGTTTACVQEWSPWPFAAIAVAFMAGGVFLAARAHSRGQPPGQIGPAYPGTDEGRDG
ncbi:hypothetical protein [Leekyejoonella antrihumi]|uniref:Uncharacterized protein n=1 Tax=Leekyejoonella antrihumi TaxID=1660198 RepID=A0A563E9R5_9MICO|nr:hypothetical protein [Leekyejoonella antrihumi]TWP38544.1 hypothetical protein FGL98_01765 [Leekyejoonella antrihumi]